MADFLKDYSKLTYWTEERKAYYEQVDKSENKKLGDHGEELAKRWFINHGYEIRESTAQEDAKHHADFWVNICGEWKSVDVKYKTEFWVELVNHFGYGGWIYKGADIIFQIIHDNKYWGDSAYYYQRNSFVEYIKKNMGLFQRRYCKPGNGKSILWILSKKRLSEMQFITKIQDWK